MPGGPTSRTWRDGHALASDAPDPRTAGVASQPVTEVLPRAISERGRTRRPKKIRIGSSVGFATILPTINSTPSQLPPCHTEMDPNGAHAARSPVTPEGSRAPAAA